MYITESGTFDFGQVRFDFGHIHLGRVQSPLGESKAFRNASPPKTRCPKSNLPEIEADTVLFNGFGICPVNYERFRFVLVTIVTMSY